MTTKFSPPNSFQWIAEYDGGKLYSQYGADGRSFKQVLAFSEEDRLDKLHIVRLVQGKEDSLDETPRFSVDMRTGIFEVLGQSINKNPNVVLISNLMPVCYHSVRAGLGVGGGASYPAYIKTYKLGWQMNIDGKNYQRIVSYDVPRDIYEFTEKR